MVRVSRVHEGENGKHTQSCAGVSCVTDMTEVDAILCSCGWTVNIIIFSH